MYYFTWKRELASNILWLVVDEWSIKYLVRKTVTQQEFTLQNESITGL